MTVIFEACHACLIKEECESLGCAITRKPVYKGPPAREAQVVQREFVTCEGCTTHTKCVDLLKCVGPDTPHARATGVRKSTHDLKCWPEYFCPVKNKLKTFEVRYNDRDYQEGDRLYLREFIPCHLCMGKGTVKGISDLLGRCECLPPHGMYTGRQEIFQISYMLSEYPGLQPGFVVLALQPLIRS